MGKISFVVNDKDHAIHYRTSLEMLKKIACDKTLCEKFDKNELFIGTKGRSVDKRLIYFMEERNEKHYSVSKFDWLKFHRPFGGVKKGDSVWIKSYIDTKRMKFLGDEKANLIHMERIWRNPELLNSQN